MTYGQVAKLAGSPRGARQVVRILHSMSKKHGLPWHRVINSKGQLPYVNDEMLEHHIFLLNTEGVEVSAGRNVSLERYQVQSTEQPFID